MSSTCRIKRVLCASTTSYTSIIGNGSLVYTDADITITQRKTRAGNLAELSHHDQFRQLQLSQWRIQGLERGGGSLLLPSLSLHHMSSLPPSLLPFFPSTYHPFSSLPFSFPPSYPFPSLGLLFQLGVS